MHLRLQTSVQQPLSTVWAGFDRSLFKRLSPPFPPVTVVRFDGCQRGDIVHLRLNFGLFRSDWISRITDQQTTSGEIYFVDEGEQLPFFLRYWRHHHRLLTNTGQRDGDALVLTTPLGIGITTTAIKAGVAPEKILDVLGGGLAGNKVMEAKREKFLGHSFDPGFRIELHHKDLGIALAAGREYGVALPVTAVVDQMLETLKAKGRGGEDHSAILTLIEESSGHEIGNGGS